MRVYVCEYYIDDKMTAYKNREREKEKSLYGIFANVLNCDIKVSKFKPQLCYYDPFYTNTLEKGMNSLIPQAMGWIIPLVSF